MKGEGWSTSNAPGGDDERENYTRPMKEKKLIINVRILRLTHHFRISLNWVFILLLQGMNIFHRACVERGVLIIRGMLRDLTTEMT